MYQSLIWRMEPCHQPRGLRPPLDAEDVKRPPNSLVDRMRRNAELDGDFFRREMLIDQQQGIELPLAEPGDASRDRRFGPVVRRSARLARILAVYEIARHQHNWLFTGKDEFRQSASLNRF